MFTKSLQVSASVCHGVKLCLPRHQHQLGGGGKGGLETALLFIYLYITRDISVFLNSAALVSSPRWVTLGFLSPGSTKGAGAGGRGAGDGVAPCRVGDPAGGAAVSADSRHSRRPQGLIVPCRATPPSHSCPLPPHRCPPPRGLQFPSCPPHPGRWLPLLRWW